MFLHRIYSHVMRPSQLPLNSNYYLSRNRTAPAWESFPNGGSWNVRADDANLDRMFEELVR